MNTREEHPAIRVWALISLLALIVIFVVSAIKDYNSRPAKTMVSVTTSLVITNSPTEKKVVTE